MDFTPEMRAALDATREQYEGEFRRRLEDVKQQVVRLEAGLRRETEQHCATILRLEQVQDQLKAQQSRAEFAEAEVARLEAWFEHKQELALDRQTTIKRIVTLENELQQSQQANAALREQLLAEADQVSRFTLELVDVKLELEKARNQPNGPAQQAPSMHLPAVMEPTAEEEEARYLQRLAYEDPVTKLPNFHLGIRYLNQQVAKAATGAATVALARIDVQRFRDLNLVLGPEVSDALLRQLASRISALLAGDEVLVRGRDDEFWLILSTPARGPLGLKKVAESVSQIVQRLMGTLKTPLQVADHTIAMGLACGIFTGQGKESGEEMVEYAGLALSHSQNDPRARITHYQPEMQRPIRHRMQRVPLLRQALAREQFELHFQPMVELKTRQIKGVESLLRWNHPVEGRMEPADFIEAAIESGVIVGIGDWVIQQVCQLSQDQRQYYWSMNVSAQELVQADFVRRFTRAIQAAQLARPDFLVVEISETGLLGQSERLVAAVKELRRWRVQVAIDDFSFNAVSLRHLQKLDVNFLKLGPEITANLELPLYRNLVRGAVLAAETLGCKVVAEGIELPFHIDTLLELGCHWGQGHLLRPPLPLGEMLELLALPKR